MRSSADNGDARSEPGSGRPSLLSSTTIPDLTDLIIRPDDQYCEAGGFGDVFRCRYTSEDGVKEVAVKAFRFSFTVDEHKRDGGKAARMIRRELGIWKRLSHRNVVPFLGVAYGFGRQGSASLVSMWMPHGTLHMFLEAHDDRLAVAHRLQLLLDIANGLRYLHSFPMIHGDLSSNNVLLDHNFNACLTDFGCASLVGEHPEGFAYLKMSTVRPGTLRWAAPEHFSFNEEETKHTIKSDIYSFGNMALLVLSGKYPWSEVRADPAVMLRLSQGHKPGRPLTRPIDDRHWALIEWCWSSIPERPLAEDVVSTLQQLLGAYPPPLPLRGLLDVPATSSVPICPGNDDLDDEVTPTESPLDRPWTRIGASASTSPPAPKDITEGARDRSEEPSRERPLDTDTAILGANLSNTVVARCLPTDLNEAQARELFQSFGELKRFNFVREDGDGPSEGIASFEYVDASVADVAVQSLNGMELGDCCVSIERKGISSLDADDTCRPPLTERKAMGDAKGKKPTRADRGDSKKPPERARVGYSPSGPSTRSKHGLRADPPSDGPPPISEWVRGTPLGKGTYGSVYLALNMSTGEMIAVKQVEKGNKHTQRLNPVPELKREREILKGLDHPHIVAYLGSEETATSLSIFLEYVVGGSIASCLREYGRFNEEVVKSFTAQILDGLAYLHANNVIHRNIEADNILVDSSGICKISGFGNAQRTDDDRASWTPTRGTVLWTAPEMIRSRSGKRYGPKVDIWSMGYVLLKMWTGGRAWRDGDVFSLMVKATRQGTSPPLPLDVILSDLAVDFRNRCFVIDPEARASATELVQHPYLMLAPDWVFTEFK